jgi:hypothetical protein
MSPELRASAGSTHGEGVGTNATLLRSTKRARGISQRFIEDSLKKTVKKWVLMLY